MRKQLPDSVREAICREHDAGESCEDIARKFGILRQTVASVIAVYKETRRMTSMKGGRPRSAGRAKEEIRGLIGEIGPFTTLESVRACIFKKYGVRMSTSTVGRIKKEIIDSVVIGPVAIGSGVTDSVVNGSCVVESCVIEADIIEPSVVKSVAIEADIIEADIISENDRDSLDDFSISSFDSDELRRPSLPDCGEEDE